MGLTPAKKSSHLVVGGAVHAGMEMLLREGQRELDHIRAAMTGPESTIQDQLAVLFETSRMDDGELTFARNIENMAVAVALADFSLAWSDGVDLDPEEARQRAAAAGQTEVVGGFADLVANPIGGVGTAVMTTESPIVVDFADFGMTVQAAPADLTPAATASAPAWQPFDQDAWLKEEMAALVEGIVRCWSRRRWKDTLQTYEILEVEKEGCWKLAEHRPLQIDVFSTDPAAPFHTVLGDESFDLYFLSRHDALLLERNTGYLYLQSFKTTGSWDRRKELDAQVDMQGLSEAVDVERRFGEAWDLVHEESHADGGLAAARRIAELVSPRVSKWLSTLPDPPTILGVRYEYLLKGSRKENKKAQLGEPRWNQESVLVRAYAQEGITSADRRWAWTYDWQDETGKGRRLDYRSWQKRAVWPAMTIAEWIDLLDQGKVQEGALGEDGEPLDALGAQLVPVLVAYRAQDEMLDLLEQLEAQEVQIAKDVEAVRQAEREGGYAAKRSELNRRFGQNRQACSYPGICPYRSTATQPGFCFGPPDAEHDAGVMEHYRARQPNHPQEALAETGNAS